MLPNIRRTTENERGAVLIITALLVPALILVGALAFGVTTLWTGRQDAQRAVDLGALAAAADTPTVSPELPIAGTDLFQTLTPGLDPIDWKQRACKVASDQLVLAGRSPVSQGMRADTTAPDCTVTYEWESPLLATLAACVQDVAELAGCKDDLEQELRSTLPALDSLDASASSAAAAVGGLLPPTDKLLTPALASQLRNACVAEASVNVLGHVSVVCTANLGNLLSAVNTQTGALLGPLSPALAPIIGAVQAAAAAGGFDATGGGLGFDSTTQVPQLGVDISGLAPALLTPRVHVDVTGLTMKPTFSPLTFDVSTGATARRTFKSALVLPTVGFPGVNAWSSLPPELQAWFQGRLGSHAASLLQQAGTDGFVVDPNVLTRSVTDAADRSLAFVDAVDSTTSTKVSTALCSDALPMGVSCPVGDDVVDEHHLLDPFAQDLHDVTRPPPAGTAPSVNDVLAQYAASGETLLVTGVTRPFSLARLLGSSVWSVLQDGSVNPAITGLLAPLMFVPALDVVPVTVSQANGTYVLQRAIATTGLYEARLVK